jgi:hypothetical protein
MALAVDITCLQNFLFPFFVLVLMYLVLLLKLVAQISTSFPILVRRLSVLYHNFYSIFSFYILAN